MKNYQISVLFIISVHFIMCSVVQGHFRQIQCYMCDDCDVVDDSLLKSCPLKTTTAKPNCPTQPLPTTSIMPPTPKTSHLTEATTNPTGTNTHSTPTTSSTTRNSTATTPSTTTKNSTATIPSPTTSHSTVTSPPEFETTTAAESSSSPNTITESQEPITEEVQTSTEQTTDDPTSTEPTTDDPTPTSSEEVKTSTEQTTYDPTSSTGSTTVPESQLGGQRKKYESFASIHCYHIDIVDNYKWKKKRGCVFVDEDETACGVLFGIFGANSKNCKICSQDRCNNSAALMYSEILLAVIVLVLLC